MYANVIDSYCCTLDLFRELDFTDLMQRRKDYVIVHNARRADIRRLMLCMLCRRKVARHRRGFDTETHGHRGRSWRKHQIRR